MLTAVIMPGKPDSIKAQVDVNDSLALVTLYNSTNGLNWTHRKNWLTKNPVSKWYGIIVSAQRVFYLGLNDNNLSGSIPPEIGNLTKIWYLHLNNNNLSGNIPPEIGKLTHLYELHLQNNQLNGNIQPEIGRLSIYLYDLYLNNNQLSGNIPLEIGMLTKLQNLDLADNQLSGNIPVELCYLYQLLQLSLNHNLLKGSVPPEISNLANLEYLYLSDNNLSGKLPASSIVKLKKLRVLSLSNNQLKGFIPPNIGNCKKLESLDLSDNGGLTGTIPTSVSELINLKSLKLNRDRMEGPLPAFLGNMPGLDSLEILFNHFNFDGIETLATQNFDRFRYWSQQKINIHRNNNTLSIYAGGTLSNNTYKWFKDGVLTATIVGDSTYTATESGTYNVEVTNSIATELTLHSEALTFTTVTALRQNNITSTQTRDKSKFSIYPNPAKSNTTIAYSTTGNCIIRITDASGRILQTKTITATTRRNTLQLNVSKYAAGLYFVTMCNDNGDTHTLKLKKQ